MYYNSFSMFANASTIKTYVVMKKYPVYAIENFSCNSSNSELYINTFKEHLQNHSFVEKPHRHNSYVLVFFTSGSGIHEIDFDTFSIKAGSLFVLQPGQMHHWELSADIEGYVVFYSQQLYNLYFGQKKIEDYPFSNAVTNKPEVVFNPDEVKAIQPYFELLFKESSYKKMYTQDKIMNLLDTINIEIARKYTGTDLHHTHVYNVKIKDFEIVLEQYFRTQKLPSFYADKLNITLKHLNRICKEVIEKTATEVITDRIILEAKRMLTDKQLSINEIAETLGYEDYSYFTRVFKKRVRLSPTAFRSK